MKIFITLSKKTLGIILSVLVILIVLSGQLVSANLNKIDGSTNAKRMFFLKNIGIEADDSKSFSKTVIIPKEFGEVYNSYNKLQKKAGFDLSKYKGETATVYTYPINERYHAHIIVYDNSIIGGDIAALSVSGKMKPLIKN